MAGFSISLKNRVAKKAVPKKNAFSNETIEKTHTQIDGFSRKGAMQGSQSVAEKNTLVITPLQAASTLPKRANAESNQDPKQPSPNTPFPKQVSPSSSSQSTANQPTPPETSGDLEDRATEALLTDTETTGLVIPKSSQMGQKTGQNPEKVVPAADYEAIPVEQFGAAFLRGMGWDGRFEKAEKTPVRRKMGAVLGIGAKPLDGDLESELTKKNISAPLKMKAREGDAQDEVKQR